VELNSLNVMMEGARRFDEYNEIAHALPAGDTVIRLNPSPQLSEPEITLTAEDAEVLTAVNGERTLDEILTSAGNGEYAASKSFFKLLKADLVEECPEAAQRNSRRAEETQLYDLVFRLYSHSLQALRKVLAEYLGASGERRFFEVPADCASDDADLVGILMAGSGGSEEAFRKSIKRISDPVRLHRVLGLANTVLSDKVTALRDRVGPAITKRVVTAIEKEVTFLLAQKRTLANRYDIDREFRQALKGV
jgi:hypothetical protein